LGLKAMQFDGLVLILCTLQVALFKFTCLDHVTGIVFLNDNLLL